MSYLNNKFIALCRPFGAGREAEVFFSAARISFQASIPRASRPTSISPASAVKTCWNNIRLRSYAHLIGLVFTRRALCLMRKKRVSKDSTDVVMTESPASKSFYVLFPLKWISSLIYSFSSQAWNLIIIISCHIFVITQNEFLSFLTFFFSPNDAHTWLSSAVSRV